MKTIHDKEVHKQLEEEFVNLPDDSPTDADSFFERWSPGNNIVTSDRPIERWCDYRDLMVELIHIDRQKFDRIHKGVPFYYLAWLAFDFGNYESGQFFIDAALSEDIRRDSVNWISFPAAKFLTLQEPESQVARRTILDIKHNLKESLASFNNATQELLSIDDFINRFINILIYQQDYRVLISAFYTFFLKTPHLDLDIYLRRSINGSSAQFINHLFSGALLFESLLKNKYPAHRNDVLSIIYDDPVFKSNYPTVVRPTRRILVFQDVINNRPGINSYDLADCFETIYKIRNTTGHNLEWDDQLVIANYHDLSLKELFAIYYLIKKEF